MSTGLTDAIVLLGAALLSVLLFRRIGLGAVLGYLVAGAAVGPDGLGLVGGGEAKLAFAEIGIAFLLFLVGLELNVARLMRLRREIFGVGLAQLMLSAAGLFALIWFATEFSAVAAIALALPLALSSTAQVLPGLKSSGRINAPFGERAFSILLLQDLAIVPLITAIGALSRVPDPEAPSGLVMAGTTIGAIVALVAAGRLVLNPLLRLVGRVGDRELFVVVGLFVVLAASGLMHALHLSIALGAFVAGVMLADSPYRHELETDIEPFRSILLGLFFLSVGMLLDLDVIRDRPLTVIGLAAGVVAVKTAALWLVARWFGMDNRPAIALALLLSQGGEFGFVLFRQAQEGALIAPAAESLMGAVVTLSMATTPFLMLLARRLEAPGGKPRADLPGPDAAPRRRGAIVVGHGRVGQQVTQLLHAVDCPVTLIDRRPQTIELSGRFDVTVYYGDGLRLDVLEQAGARDASLIVFAIDGTALDAETIGRVRRAFPDAAIVARAFDRRHLMDLGGDDPDATGAVIVRETFESAVRMGCEALALIGTPEPEIADAVHALRQLDAARLAEQVAAGDVAAGRDLRFTEERGRRPRELLEQFADRLVPRR